MGQGMGPKGGPKGGEGPCEHRHNGGAWGWGRKHPQPPAGGPPALCQRLRGGRGPGRGPRAVRPRRAGAVASSRVAAEVAGMATAAPG